MKSLLIIMLSAVLAVAADEPPANPQTSTHRITGLFSPDREADLRRALGLFVWRHARPPSTARSGGVVAPSASLPGSWRAKSVSAWR